MTTTTTKQAPRSMGRNELRGRASAVFLLSFFTFVWVGWGLAAGTTTAVIVLCVAAVACLTTVACGIRLYRASGRREPEPALPAVYRRYWTVVGAELAGIGIATGVLGGTGNAQWIPAVVCLGVGWHFVPLGMLFRMRMYHVTAAAMTVAAVATMLLVPLAGLPADAWHMIPGFGAAVTLWTTVVALLATSRVR